MKETVYRHCPDGEDIERIRIKAMKVKVNGEPPKNPDQSIDILFFKHVSLPNDWLQIKS